MPGPAYPIDVPPLVAAARRHACALGFHDRPEGNRPGDANGPSSCIDEAGAVLRTLAATVTSGIIGEIGTGGGVGTAWLASGLRESSRLVSVELDAHLAAGATALFEPHHNVEVIAGDWQGEFLDHAPFDLLFADGGGAVNADPATLAGLLTDGGLLVIDDLTPESHWPEGWRNQPDPKRELAFRSGLFESTEVLLRPDIALLILARR